jgi:hypothetical protein
MGVYKGRMRWLQKSHLSDEGLLFQAFMAGVGTAYCMPQVRTDEHAYSRARCGVVLGGSARGR